ncbi:MAG: CvpA family protein [Planctomycetaceae bacterium]|nr:CvpA family protein [Planctomycetaceae bacterium]
MIDILLLAVVAIVTWMVASDGPWGAGVTFVSVLLSGLVAMNFFEPVAAFLSTNVMNSFAWQHYWDIIALLGIFAGGVFLLRTIGEKLLPTVPEVNQLAYEVGRWGLGAMTGYTTMAILLTSLHVAPLPREFLGFAPERNNFFMVSAPDRQWLALTQYVSERSLRNSDAFGNPTVFDGVNFERIPGDPSTMTTWSSFPMKYAARRELFATGGIASPAAAPAPVSTPPAAPAAGQPAPPAQNGAANPPPANRPANRQNNSGAGGF